jgi:2-keto-4-pentenoate hydratase/2-oxohepta-3-ene-1,7-dioic acid hydratase in catechol pathway
MKIVRFKHNSHTRYGVKEGDIIRCIRGNPFDQFTTPGCHFEFDGNQCRFEEVTLLPPCLPSKIVCVGMNHWSMVDEDHKPHDTPLIFIKPGTAIIGPEENIEFSASMKNVGFEGELAAVIGRTAKNIPEEKAGEYILGYTCHNDVSDYDAIKEDGFSLTRGKARDTFGPLGPWIETDLDLADTKLESYLNGELFQSGYTRDLIHSVGRLFSFMSGIMTLLPGDVVSTGTPKKSPTRLKHEDVVEIVIDGIGSLKNYVVQK